MIITIFYSGQLIGFFFCSLIGDLIRPKIQMVGGLVVGMAGSLILAFSDIQWLSITGMWILAFGLTIPFNLTFVFATELVEEQKSQKYKIVICFIFSIGALAVVLWFYIIPKFKDVLLYFYAIPLLALTLIFAFFFKDTPISMVTKL